MVRYTYQIISIFGHIELIEEKLGSGKSYIALKIIGIVGFIFGLLFLFGKIGFAPNAVP